MKLRVIAASVALALSAPASAFESDVHFGLTQWLALQAGFTPSQAEAIAIGNNRTDSGDMQYIDLSFVYACYGTSDDPARRASDDDATRQISAHHYRTAGTVPGPVEQRTVPAGGDVSLGLVKEVMKAPPSYAGFLLFKFGEALNSMQDTWAHQGLPEVPQIPDKLFACDTTRAWGHPASRGGWNSHRADLTANWPADTLAMAKATYDVLVQYPKIQEDRKPKDWNDVRPLLDGFIKASTKSDKRAWFAAQGIQDVSFLEGTSLKDGKEPFDQKWAGRKLPRLPSSQSRQHYIDQAILDFYSKFFADWMTTDNLDTLAASVTLPRPAKPPANTFVPMDKNELAANLKLWRMRDHGTAQDLAHSPKRLTTQQIAAANALAKPQNALIRYGAATEAFFPLVTKGKDASPLLPFIVGDAPAAPNGDRRVVATAKFRHAPYDIVGVVAELVDGQWRVISVVSQVDH